MAFNHIYTHAALNLKDDVLWKFVYLQNHFILGLSSLKSGYINFSNFK